MADRHGAVAGDVEAELDLLDVLASALGTPIGGHGGRRLAHGQFDLIGPVQLDGGDVVVDLVDVEPEPLDRLEDQGGLDGGGMFGEAFQGASEPVVVELLDSQVVIVGQGSGAGPLSDAEEGLGLEQAVGDEDLDQGAQGDIALPGDDPVDGGGEVKLLEVMSEDGECPDDLGIEANGGVHGRDLLGRPGISPGLPKGSRCHQLLRSNPRPGVRNVSI
jgi:hypothetical protein